MFGCILASGTDGPAIRPCRARKACPRSALPHPLGRHDGMPDRSRHVIGTCSCCTPDLADRGADRGLTCEGGPSGSLSAGERVLQARVEKTLLGAIIPRVEARRAFLRAVGGASASAALAQFFPVMTAGQALCQAAPLEKKKLAVGFLPITGATPIIMARPPRSFPHPGPPPHPPQHARCGLLPHTRS